MLEHLVKLGAIILDNHQKILSRSFATHSPKISGEYLPAQSFPFILSYFLFLQFTSSQSTPYIHDYRSRA